MNWFKLPKYICKDIDGFNWDFFWKDNCDKHKLHTLACDKICSLKCEGGLGIRKTEYINAVFLAKQGWNILTRPENIWVYIVKAKYLKTDGVSFFKTKKCSSALKHRRASWIKGST